MAVTPDTDELRALAEQADDGPWFVKDLMFGGPSVWRGTDIDHFKGYEAVANFNQLYGGARNAAYIAAASPDVVLALLDERDRLRDALERSHEYIWTRAGGYYHAPGARPIYCDSCTDLVGPSE